MSKARLILAGDVGGTKTHLALFGAEGHSFRRLGDELFRTHDFECLENVVRAFVGRHGEAHAMCFGVPGPVIEGVSHATNVPWKIDERALEAAFGVGRVRLVNDLEATAYGMLYLRGSGELLELQHGVAAAKGANIAVIAAGTGLGEAALVPDDRGGYRALASEGGHSDFAPRGREQMELLEFLVGEFDHVSFERVLSGPGLVNIYRFLRHTMTDPEPEWLARELEGADPAAAISGAALARRDSRCVRALDLFVAIYGAEAANLALKTLALGGVYVGGGIAPKIAPALNAGGFMRAFCDKGRLSGVLGRIPCRVALDETAALRGAAHIGAALL